MHDVVIIGCGIVGAACAFELSKYDLDVAVLEAENDVAAGTTKANSAIIHAGYDPLPESLMARLNVRGSALAKELCKKLDVPYKQTGSLVLAFSEDEADILGELLQRGKQNGVQGLEILDRAQILEREPEISPEVVAALYAPGAAIVSPWEYALALAETAVKNGVKIHLETKVTAIGKTDGGYEITAGGGSFRAKSIINAAGIGAEELHNMLLQPGFKTIPDRGEYYLLDKSEGGRVKNIIFQCPTKLGKGVLIAPTVHGNLIVGPNAERVHGDDTANTADGLECVARLGRKSVPKLNFRDSIRNFAGVRALTDIDDFIITRTGSFIDLAGIKSPGLSAAPAIAEMAVDLLRETGLALEKKQGFAFERSRVRFNELSPEERGALTAKDPRYGRIICRCESITEGEILDAFASPVPPRSIDAVKRRCNAGMGRCQGGFCGPRVLELLSRESGATPTEILQDKAGSRILTSETKGASQNV